MNKIVNGVANDYEFEPPISAYGSVDLNELTKTIERLKKVPNFDVLLKENNKLQQELNQSKNNWEELKRYIIYNIEITKETIAFNQKLDKSEVKKYERDINSFEMILDKMKELEKGK